MQVARILWYRPVWKVYVMGDGGSNNKCHNFFSKMNVKSDNFSLQTTFCEQLAGAGQGAGHSRKLGVVRSRVVATYIIPQVDYCLASRRGNYSVFISWLLTQEQWS